jgi:hypothetical protein
VTKARKRYRELIWPVIGVGAAASISLSHPTRLPVAIAVAALAADALLVLLLAYSCTGTRFGALIAGLSLAVPFSVASPLVRLLLLCSFAIPFLFSTALVTTDTIHRAQDRLAYLLTWFGTQRIYRRPKHFDAAGARDLMLATFAFYAAIAIARGTTASPLGLVILWFAAGVAIIGLAEMLTAATSVFPRPSAFRCRCYSIHRRVPRRLASTRQNAGTQARRSCFTTLCSNQLPGAMSSWHTPLRSPSAVSHTHCCYMLS